MNAEIIAVGSELLLGQITNTNAQFLSKQLSELGINVYYHTVVGDNAGRLKEAIEMAESRADMIMLYVSLFFTIWSGWDYFYLNRKVLLESK